MQGQPLARCSYVAHNLSSFTQQPCPREAGPESCQRKKSNRTLCRIISGNYWHSDPRKNPTPNHARTNHDLMSTCGIPSCTTTSTAPRRQGTCPAHEALSLESSSNEGTCQQQVAREGHCLLLPTVLKALQGRLLNRKVNVPLEQLRKDGSKAQEPSTKEPGSAAADGQRKRDQTPCPPSLSP